MVDPVVGLGRAVGGVAAGPAAVVSGLAVRAGPAQVAEGVVSVLVRQVELARAADWRFAYWHVAGAEVLPVAAVQAAALAVLYAAPEVRSRLEGAQIARRFQTKNRSA